MAKQITILTVFLSCSSEMEADKVSVASAVAETNKLLRASESLIQFEVWEWKSDSMGGVGSDPQDVIDQQIPEHDVYLGLMWKRFGYPTSKYGSGTEHEFRTSLEKHQKKQSPKNILFLFKTSIDSLTEIDVDEWVKVTAFKKGLGDLGVLHQSYETSNDLEQLLRLHLSKIAHSWNDGPGPLLIPAPIDDSLAVPRSEQVPVEIVENNDAFDLDSGYLDYLDDFQTSLERAGELIMSMHQPLNQLTTSMQTGTSQLKDAIKSYGKGKVPISISLVVSNSVGDELLTFANLGVSLTEEADSHFNNAFDYLESAIDLARKDVDFYRSSDISTLPVQLDSFMEIVESSRKHVKEMASQITLNSHSTSKMKRGARELSKYASRYSRMCSSMRSRVENLKAFILSEFSEEQGD